jgi:hypothetical protein
MINVVPAVGHPVTNVAAGVLAIILVRDMIRWTVLDLALDPDISPRPRSTRRREHRRDPDPPYDSDGFIDAEHPRNGEDNRFRPKGIGYFNPYPKASRVVGVMIRRGSGLLRRWRRWRLAVVDGICWKSEEYGLEMWLQDKSDKSAP